MVMVILVADYYTDYIGHDIEYQTKAVTIQTTAAKCMYNIQSRYCRGDCPRLPLTFHHMGAAINVARC